MRFIVIPVDNVAGDVPIQTIQMPPMFHVKRVDKKEKSTLFGNEINYYEQQNCLKFFIFYVFHRQYTFRRPACVTEITLTKSYFQKCYMQVSILNLRTFSCESSRLGKLL